MIVRHSRWWSTCVLVLLLALLSVGCVDTAAIDHQKCLSTGFVEENKEEYKYCREKLQQIRDEKYEHQLRFIEMISE